MIRLMKNERGFTLIEVMIAIALMGIIGIALLSGLATASRGLFTADERATAESLARSQIEYIKKQDYDEYWNYTVSTSQRSSSDQPSWWDADNPPFLSPEYVDYSATINATAIEAGLQRIRVTVYHNLEEVTTTGDYTLEGYKADR